MIFSYLCRANEGWPAARFTQITIPHTMTFPIILRSSWFPYRPFAGISLFGVFIFRKDCHLSDTMIRHETIHYYQQREWAFLPFFLLYNLEFCFYYLRYWNYMKAYHAISFEREAYRYERQVDYLEHRPLWANYRMPKE